MKLIEKIAGFFENLTPRGLLGLSAAAGLLAFALVFIVLSNSGGKSGGGAKETIPMVKVVTAKVDIAPRTEIREEMLKVVEIPQSASPDDAVKEISAIVGKPARVAIMSGDVLTPKKVFPDKKSAGFPGMVPEDCRAVTLAIDDVTGVSGFALPGDYVDVMLISDKLQNGKITGEVVMQNVLLLGINKDTDGTSSSASKDDKDKGAASAGPKAVDKPATATLAVRPEEAVRLSVASQVGKLYLALRPFKPTNRYITDTTYDVTVDQGKAAQSAPQTSAPASSPAPVQSAPTARNSGGASSKPAAKTPKVDRGVDTVEVIRGTSSTKE
ncbi:MAG: Flp pilus assembly protein CpaB [Selenomonadaceae bacterium]|nr:Flp pilus assembly protein CpaB [Selenomonadaceae bacterium]